MLKRVAEICYSVGMAKRFRSPLTKIVTTNVHTIKGVVRVMTQIETSLSQDDGLWWFNWLYRRVTIAIEEECQKQKWLAPRWVTELDVEFGKLYFEAIAAWERDPDDCPHAWRPLFVTRRARYLAPVQYALAGLCAHINRDLPVAAVRAAQKLGTTLQRGSPEEQDYQRINAILYEVELKCVQDLTTGWMKGVSTRIDPYDRKLAITIVRWLRDLAWSHAQVYANALTQGEKRAEKFLFRLDRATEWIARGMLVPTTWRRASHLSAGRK